MLFREGYWPFWGTGIWSLKLRRNEELEGLQECEQEKI